MKILWLEATAVMKFLFNTKKILTFSEEKASISNREIIDVATIKNLKNNSLIFINNIDDIDISVLNNLKDCLLILDDIAKLNKSVIDNNDFIISKKPRLTYAKVLQFILENNNNKTIYKNIGDNIFAGQNFIVNDNVTIEPCVTIGKNVTIGSNTYICSGVRIGDNVIIGNDCIIRNNTVVGGYGFGTEIDEDGTSYRIPHLGSVYIGNNVDIGSLNTVVSGTIEPTIIEDNVMTDDHVHIAHNCHIGQSSMLTACVEISGSVYIGKNVYIGPNSSIINKIKIGDNVTIGIGSLINKDISSNQTMAGSPAKEISELIRERKRIKELLK